MSDGLLDGIQIMLSLLVFLLSFLVVYETIKLRRTLKK